MTARILTAFGRPRYTFVGLTKT